MEAVDGNTEYEHQAAGDGDGDGDGEDEASGAQINDYENWEDEYDKMYEDEDDGNDYDKMYD